MSTESYEAQLAAQSLRHEAELAAQSSRHATELADRIWCAVYHQGDTLEDISARINVPVDRVRELRDLHTETDRPADIEV